MAHRSSTNDALPGVDASLFDEISAESMALAAREIVAAFGNLPDEEARLLVHLKSRKGNL